ncbi:unnamed protein product [Discosporangium mesarthrocarpum]
MERCVELLQRSLEASAEAAKILMTIEEGWRNERKNDHDNWEMEKKKLMSVIARADEGLTLKTRKIALLQRERRRLSCNLIRLNKLYREEVGEPAHQRETEIPQQSSARQRLPESIHVDLSAAPPNGSTRQSKREQAGNSLEERGSRELKSTREVGTHQLPEQSSSERGGGPGEQRPTTPSISDAHPTSPAPSPRRVEEAGMGNGPLSRKKLKLSMSTDRAAGRVGSNKSARTRTTIVVSRRESRRTSERMKDLAFSKGEDEGPWQPPDEEAASPCTRDNEVGRVRDGNVPRAGVRDRYSHVTMPPLGDEVTPEDKDRSVQEHNGCPGTPCVPQIGGRQELLGSTGGRESATLRGRKSSKSSLPTSVPGTDLVVGISALRTVSEWKTELMSGPSGRVRSHGQGQARSDSSNAQSTGYDATEPRVADRAESRGKGNTSRDTILLEGEGKGNGNGPSGQNVSKSPASHHGAASGTGFTVNKEALNQMGATQRMVTGASTVVDPTLLLLRSPSEDPSPSMCRGTGGGRW